MNGWGESFWGSGSEVEVRDEGIYVLEITPFHVN